VDMEPKGSGSRAVWDEEGYRTKHVLGALLRGVIRGWIGAMWRR